MLPINVYGIDKINNPFFLRAGTPDFVKFLTTIEQRAPQISVSNVWDCAELCPRFGLL